MISSLYSRLFLPGLAAVLTLTSATAPASIIYRNAFGNNSEGYANYASVGWSAYAANSAAAVVSNRSSNANSNVGLSGAGGNPTNLPNINAGEAASLTNGFGILRSGQVGLLFTDSFLLNPALLDFDTLSFSWTAAQYKSNISTTNSTMRVALRVGGQWYVSNSITVAPAATIPVMMGSTGDQQEAEFANYATSYSRDLTTLNWFTLNFTVGDVTKPFSIGGSAVTPFPAGSIDGFGLYVTAPGSGGLFVDTYTLSAEAIPEASTLSLIFGGIILGSARFAFSYGKEKNERPKP